MWSDKKFYKQTSALLAASNFNDVRVDAIISGKFRRYHNLSIIRQLLRPVTIVWPNIVDFAKVLIGIAQSLLKLLVWRPDVVFAKGGFVCLPVGIAAYVVRIPLVIHDSDTHPGLTNRILARFAKKIATGAPLENYSYPASKTVYVGIPISSDFSPKQEKDKKRIKNEHGFDADRPLVIVTGGGLGAVRINNAVMSARKDICEFSQVLLLSGAKQFNELQAINEKEPVRGFFVKSFLSDNVPDVFGSADVFVARAGATTILELAALAMPTILIPNPYLTGGHQLKNASVYEKANATLVLNEKELIDSPAKLTEMLRSVLKDVNLRSTMGKRFKSFSRPQAASDMADIIIAESK